MLEERKRKGLNVKHESLHKEEVFLLEILKKERKTKILSFRCCCSHKSGTATF